MQRRSKFCGGVFVGSISKQTRQGHGVSAHCTAAEVMGLLGRKLGGGGSALIADAEAIPLLNEAWQVGPVCVRLGWGGVWMRTPGRRVTKDGPRQK